MIVQKFDTTLTNETDVDNFEKHILDLSFKMRKSWTSSSNIKIRNLNGGLTNTLYAVYSKDKGLNTNDTLLFRIYGKNTDSFLSRSTEITNMLAMKGIELGPDVYFKFNNGICYEYLPGDIATYDIVTNDRYFPSIAECVAKMHSYKFDDYKNNKSEIFIKIKQILNIVNEDYMSTMHDMTVDMLKVIPNKESLSDEVNFLQDKITSSKGMLSRIVNSHNDLLLGNIIINEEKPGLVSFIDYEYGGSNYQAFDIANHFNEFPGVDMPIDYENKYPNKSFQCLWLTKYWNSFKAQTGIDIIIDDDFIDRFYDEVDKFTCVSHLLWAIWALVQAQNEQESFNFVEYAHNRFREYFRKKKIVLQ